MSSAGCRSAWSKPRLVSTTLGLLYLLCFLLTYGYYKALLSSPSLQSTSKYDQRAPDNLLQSSQYQRVRTYDVPAPSGPWSRAFLFNSTTIVAVLLKPVIFVGDLARHREKSCRYGPFVGIVTSVHGTIEAHEHPWDAAIVYCRFDKPLGDVSSQNLSSIHLPLGVRADVVDQQRPERPFNLTVCVPPVHSGLRYQWVKEWLLLYREYIGVDHTFFYSSLPDLRRRFITEGGINFRWTPFSVMDMHTQNYGQFYRGQLTSIYDCVFLNRYLETKWTLFQDLDEVLWLPPRWNSLIHLLSEKEKLYDAVSFGKWSANVILCLTRTAHSMSYIDRINVFFKGPACGEMCECWKGGRKYAAQPSRTVRLNVHFPNAGLQPGLRLLDLNVSEGFLRHYRSMSDLDMEPRPCSAVSWQQQLRTDSIPFPEFTNPRPMHDWDKWLPC